MNADIEYVTKDKTIGLSKIPRICNYYSRKLQIQERLGCEIASSISKFVENDVTIKMSCTHMCMCYRGVSELNTQTDTIYTCKYVQ